MGTQRNRHFLFWAGPALAGQYAYTAGLLDAAGEKYAAAICRSPVADTLIKVGWRTGAVTTATDTDVRVETVDLATGDPSGTLVAVGAQVTEASAGITANKYFESVLGTGPSLTKGQLIAIVIVPTGTPNYNVTSVSSNFWTFPYPDHFTAAWAKVLRTPVSHLEFTGGIYPVDGLLPWSLINQPNFTTATTPDERGIRFKLARSVVVEGFWAHARPSTTGADFTIKLYDSDGSTVLESIAHDANVEATVGSSGLFFEPLQGAARTLSADVYYRLTILPTTATNMALADFDVTSAALLDAMPGGQDCHFTQRTDAGAWTETLTKRALMGLVVSDVSDTVMRRTVPVIVQEEY